MTNPTVDVVAFLASAGLGLTKGTNLFGGTFRGPDDKTVANAVFVTSQGGAAPQRFMGQVSEIRTVFMSVQTRWSKFAGGNLKAQAIQNALRGASISGYLDVVATEAQPTSLGETESGQHLFMSMFTLVYEQT